MSTGSSTRRTTTTCSTDGVDATAASTFGLSIDGAPRRNPPSAVITTLHSASLMRSMSESGLKPPNTTEWGAPMRAQASIATGQLGDHRHVDADAVALGHAEPLQHVGEPLHVGEEVGVGDRAGVARLALPVVRDLVAAAGGDVAVDGVVADVELAADEPLGEGQVPLEDRVPLLVPVEERGGLAGPEPLPVLVRLVVEERARPPASRSLKSSGGGNVRSSTR